MVRFLLAKLDLSSTTNAGNQPSLTAHHANKLRYDLWHNLLRTTGWEAVMRVRVSKGRLLLDQRILTCFIRAEDNKASRAWICEESRSTRFTIH